MSAHRFRFCLYVYHGDEVLFVRTTLTHEIAQLEMLGDVGVIEMIRPYLQPMGMGQVNVVLVGVVLGFFALGGLEIDVSHVAVVAKCLPPDIALVVAHVKAVDVVASVFTLYPIGLGTSKKGREETDQRE